MQNETLQEKNNLDKNSKFNGMQRKKSYVCDAMVVKKNLQTL